MGRKSRAKIDPKHHEQVKYKKTGMSRTTQLRILALVVAVAVIAGAAYGIVRVRANAKRAAALGTADRVRITTSKGDIVMDVYPKAMPITVANFEKLVQAKFYDGLKWWRVEAWVVQTGDPTATGSGGSDQTINLETTPYLSNVRGAVGMARGDDPNSATSQFYVLKSDATALNGTYAVFGRVVSGMDVIAKLTTDDTVVSAVMEPAGAK